MRINQFHVARNAARQMAQRNLSPEDILAVLRSGCTFYAAGTTIFFLGWRDLPRGFGHKLERLVGTSVITAGNRIVTVYRNPKMIAAIKRRLKPFTGF